MSESWHVHTSERRTNCGHSEAQTEHGRDVVSIGELIERSSLGTPRARRMRERTSPERAQQIVARAADLEQQQSGNTDPEEMT